MLNKADQLTSPQLMRVYGALMWALGKIIDTPEVTRVYVSSFWGQPLVISEQRKLLASEQIDLYSMLSMLPRSSAISRLDTLVRRARLAWVHAFLLDYLRNKTPCCCGKESSKKQLLADLEDIFKMVSEESKVPLGDFPEVAHMQACLKKHDFSTFPKLSGKRMKALDGMLGDQIPELLKIIAEEQRQINEDANAASPWADHTCKLRETASGEEGLGNPFDQDVLEAPAQRAAPPLQRTAIEQGTTLPNSVPSPQPSDLHAAQFGASRGELA